MNFPSYEMVERIRKRYPAGTRIELIQMNDEPFPIPPGTQGSVDFVDDGATIHMVWDNGSGLGLVSGVDDFKIIE